MLVLDPRISGFLGLFAEVPLLKEHGVEQCARAQAHCCSPRSKAVQRRSCRSGYRLVKHLLLAVQSRLLLGRLLYNCRCQVCIAEGSSTHGCTFRQLGADPLEKQRTGVRRRLLIRGPGVRDKV